MTSVLLAIKYHEDEYYSNEYYAKVGGVSLKELNNLEKEFLQLIDFSLFVDKRLFNKYNSYINSFSELWFSSINYVYNSEIVNIEFSLILEMFILMNLEELLRTLEWHLVLVINFLFVKFQALINSDLL